METNRIIIYPKDVRRITGKSERASRNLLNKIKENKSKARRHFVTVSEFAEFTGLSVEEIGSFLQD
jgi:hypothetical protein